MTDEVNRPLKYKGWSIVFQEVPDEVSLSIDISGCPYKCRGCHSQYLWEYEGDYVSKNIDGLIEANSTFITCVCLFGGDQNIDDLLMILKHVKSKFTIKTCLYSGCDDIERFTPLLKYLDYLKIGSYIEELGGLNSTSTNQIMYTIDNGKINKDITYKFSKEFKDKVMKGEKEY